MWNSVSLRMANLVGSSAGRTGLRSRETPLLTSPQAVGNPGRGYRAATLKLATKGAPE